MNRVKLMLIIMLTGLAITLSGPVILFTNPNTHNDIIKNGIIYLPIIGSIQILFGVSIPFWIPYKQSNNQNAQRSRS